MAHGEGLLWFQKNYDASSWLDRFVQVWMGNSIEDKYCEKEIIKF